MKLKKWLWPTSQSRWHRRKHSLLASPGPSGDRDSAVGIATGYGLEGPGIESRWGWDFPYPSRPALRPPQPSYTMCTGSFWGVKWQGCGVDHPAPSSAEVNERVELYLYSTCGPSWPLLEWTFTFHLLCPSVSPNVSNRLTFDTFRRNFILGTSMKICPRKPELGKIR